jgi:hypothetical protein
MATQKQEKARLNEVRNPKLAEPIRPNASDAK